MEWDGGHACECRCSEPEENVGSPGNTATDECEPPDVVLRTELDPLKERYALLTTEPFFQTGVGGSSSYVLLLLVN